MKVLYLFLIFMLMSGTYQSSVAGDRTSVIKLIKAIQRNDHNEMIRQVKKIKNINSGVNDDGNGYITPLLAAVYYENTKACNYLLEHGAGIWVEYKDGLTIYDFAMLSKNTELKQLFIHAKNK